MKYKCLILDHDDTSVESSPNIHYPAFIDAMKVLRPDRAKMSLEEYFIKNFDPGFSKFLHNELELSKDEILQEYRIWRSFTERMIPSFFPGFLELLKRFKKNGGIITVVSHSEKDIIERDYKEHTNIVPDLIFGWDIDPCKRKPSIYPVVEILETFKLKNNEAIIIDDLKTGLEMAKRSGVKIAGAGWGHKIELITNHMRENCNFYFETVEEFEKFLFEE